MTPTNDYREVGDDITLRTVCGEQVLVRPRGRAWGYVRAVIDYIPEVKQWTVAYIDHAGKVRRIVLYRNDSELLKSLQVMARQ